MEDIPNYNLFQYFHTASPAHDTAVLPPNPLPNLSPTGRLAQRRHRSLETRLIQRSLLSPPQSPNFSTNLNATLPQNIPRAAQISPSASPTSSPSTIPGQVAYRQSQVLYNQMHLRLNLLTLEITKETQNRERCHRSPQPRDALVSSLEKQQEIAALQERIASMVQAIRDLSEGEDGVWGELLSGMRRMKQVQSQRSQKSGSPVDCPIWR